MLFLKKSAISLLDVILMILFSVPPLSLSFDFRRAARERGNFCRRYLSLLVVLCEDGRHVLRLGLGRVAVHLEEFVYELFVGYFCRIVFDSHGFGVTGPTRANGRVGRIRSRAARVSYTSTDDARNLLKRRFRAPKSSHGKYGYLGRRRSCLLQLFAHDWITLLCL